MICSDELYCRQVLFNQEDKTCFTVLKGLSHEFEKGGRWYG
jgi:hypothetical protein